jgi:hypothetical protein
MSISGTSTGYIEFLESDNLQNLLKAALADSVPSENELLER